MGVDLIWDNFVIWVRKGFVGMMIVNLYIKYFVLLFFGLWLRIILRMRKDGLVYYLVVWGM